MTIKSTIPGVGHFIMIALLSLILIPTVTLADDDDPMMPMMGMDSMGTGCMGMGPMGMGCMGSMGMGCRGMGAMGMGRMGMYGNHFYMLDLTDAQRKTMRDVLKKTRTETLDLQDKIADYSDQLYSLYNQDKPNAKNISDIYQQVFNLKRQIIELHINTRNQLYDQLTKEQQEKLKELKSGRMGPYGPGAYHRGMMPHMMR